MTTDTAAIHKAKYLLQDAFHYAWGVFSDESQLPCETRDEKPTVARKLARLQLATERARQAFNLLGELAAADGLDTRKPRTHAALDLAAERLMQLVGQVAHTHGVNACTGTREGVEETPVLPPYYRVVGATEDAGPLAHRTGIVESVLAELAAAEVAERAELATVEARKLAHGRALREVRSSLGLRDVELWAATVAVIESCLAYVGTDFENADELVYSYALPVEDHGDLTADEIESVEPAARKYFELRAMYAAHAQLDAEEAAAESKRAAYVARANEVAAKLTAELNAPGAPWRATAARLVAEAPVELDAEDAAHVKAHGVPEEVATLRRTFRSTALAVELLGQRLDAAQSLRTVDELRAELAAELPIARLLVEALTDALAESAPEAEVRRSVAAEANVSLRKHGFAPLTVTSTREDLVAALQSIDPNGCHTDELAAAEDCDPYTLDGAWDALAEMVS